MARSKKFRPPRRIPDTERSLFEQKLGGRYSRTLDRTDLLNLIRGGEDTHVEFKIRLVNEEKITAELVAFANSGGGALIFGVNDQRRIEGLDDPEAVEEDLINICRNGIRPPLLPRIDKVSFDNGVRIVVCQVDDRRAPHSTPDNRYFIRVGSTKRESDGAEIAQLFARSRSASFEDMPVYGTSLEDVDEALVWSYVRDTEGDAFRQPAGYPTASALQDLSLASESGIGVRPTLAGLLLFGRNASVPRSFPNSGVSVVRFSGNDVNAAEIERNELLGNLGSMHDRATLFIKRYVDLWDSRPPKAGGNTNGSGQGDPVPPRSNYSRSVVTEAVVNLLSHRSYSSSAVSRILIFDHRMEFVNPARGNGLHKRSIEYGASVPENPRMHHFLTSPEYGLEQWRRGMPALRREHYTFTRREPRITLTNEEFSLEILGV